jgi:hypothetical protein
MSDELTNLEDIEDQISILDAEVVLEYDEITYDRTAHEPDIIVVVDENTLTPQVDYIVEYIDNTDAGIAAVIITGNGAYKDTKSVTFDINPVDMDTCIITCGEPDEHGYYDIANLTVTYNSIDLILDTEYEITDSTIVDIGDKAYNVFTIHGLGNYMGDVSERFAVGPSSAKSIEDCTVTYTDRFTYTGSIIKPIVVITDDEYTLIKDVDYTVDYDNNINVGTGVIIIEGIGNYIGTINKDFEIEPAPITEAIPSCGETDYYGCYNPENFKLTYNGKVLVKDIDFDVATSLITDNEYFYTKFDIYSLNNFIGNTSYRYKYKLKEYPANDVNSFSMTPNKTTFTYNYGEPISIIFSSSLEYGVDYTVTYENNINAGDGRAIVTGINDYTGIRYFNFTIKPKSILSFEVSCGDPDEEGCYNLNNLKIKVPGTDIYLEYETEYTYTKNDVYIDKYIISILTITGINNFKDELHAEYRTLHIKPDINNYTFTVEDQSYNFGQMIEPIPETELVLNQDYIIITYRDNILVGQAEMDIEGVNNFIGTRTLSFNIIPDDIQYADIIVPQIVEENYDHDAVKIVYEGVELERNVDYSISFNDYYVVDMKISEITVTGIHNYIGIKTKKIHLNDNYLDINDKDVEIHIDEDPYMYRGTAITPLVTAETVTEGVDYVVSYEDNIHPGTAKVIVTGIGDYENSQIVRPFNIVGKDIHLTKVTCGDPNSDGYYNILNLKVKDLELNTVLKRDADYAISTETEDEINTGTRYTIVTIRGINDYGDTRKEKYPTSDIPNPAPNPANPPDIDQLVPGLPVELDEVPVYSRYCSLVSDSVKSGIFYIYEKVTDPKKTNNRIRIVKSLEALTKPGMITGWVDIDRVLKKDIDFVVGDKVYVNGQITQYANGTGTKITKENEIMYIVDYVDAEYTNNYAVASKPYREKQGWASPDMLSHCLV